MKNLQILMAAAFLLIASSAIAQINLGADMQYWRAYDQRGVNVFEAPFTDTTEYQGLKVRIGGNFTQQFQALSHSNAFDVNNNAVPELYRLSPGFNLATANLVFDIQLEDGIRISLENYMSSRHHPEFWVKGGYIQMDKLPMFDNTAWFDNHFRVRIGHFQPNYGDQMFRRTDNGNAIYNPFVGNTIMDAFTTEIGGELTYFNGPFFGLVGMTSGIINGDVQDKGYFYHPNPDISDSMKIRKMPSVLAKLGYDNQFSDDFRFRLSGSVYMNPGSSRNTLYAGDRTGSRYYMVMENTTAVAASQFTSGRINPNFTSSVTSVMINPFIKFKGLEFFGMYEIASGYNYQADVDPTATAIEFETRTVNQIMAELVFRFLRNEQAFIGARYNVLTGDMYNSSVYRNNPDLGTQSVDRLQIGAGWFATPNLLLKAEYTVQNYNGFDAKNAEGQFTDIRNNGKFSGFMIEAVVGF